MRQQTDARSPVTILFIELNELITNDLPAITVSTVGTPTAVDEFDTQRVREYEHDALGLHAAALSTLTVPPTRVLIPNIGIAGPEVSVPSAL